jgi:hypothetical protein
MRGYNVLRRNGIHTVAQILDKTEDELLGLRISDVRRTKSCAIGWTNGSVQQPRNGRACEPGGSARDRSPVLANPRLQRLAARPRAVR